MPKERIVVGIDAGTTKVTTLIAEVSRNRSVHVIGVGIAPSRGLKKGIVVDIDAMVESVVNSVEKAERVSGYKVVSAYVGLTGLHVTSLNNRGVVAITHPDRTITEDDVARAIDAAQVINIPSNREILHTIPRQFTVDGQDGVRNPVSMHGYRLDVEAHIVTGSVTAVQNLTKCFHKAEIQIDQVVLGSLAASESVLSDEEQEMGVALIDIGGGTTEVAVFSEGSIFHTGVVPVGGNHITNDIAVRLRTPFAQADDVKIRHAHAFSSDIDPDDPVEVPGFGHGPSQFVPRVQICEVAEARLQETFQLVHAEIKRSGCEGLLPAGAVLVGGTSRLSGIADLASEVLGVPVRLGMPRGAHGLVDTISGPDYATGIGLALWGARAGEPALVARPSARIDERLGVDTLRVSGRIRGWLRAILP
ncbi:MAG TPA: cell division protein FtsA [Chloroflexota bacterium]|nr:cell division protein FtsA [Chloroflexota bacterium]